MSDLTLSTQLSDEDSDDGKNLAMRNPPVMQGILSKWTNYIHGWQDRYFVLRDGTLSYYRSEGDASFGCRGSISVFRAIVKAHEIDECRFDVCLNDSVWYLRTERSDVKHQWVDAFELHKENASLKRHGSTMSLTSNTVSAATAKSSKGGHGSTRKASTQQPPMPLRRGTSTPLPPLNPPKNLGIHRDDQLDPIRKNSFTMDVPKIVEFASEDPECSRRVGRNHSDNKAKFSQRRAKPTIAQSQIRSPRTTGGSATSTAVEQATLN
ncbi:Pleckstrin domain [Trinorchestia longiramus]|nr:Pleckstrin domain [Trinorchestia longiramus]